MMKENKGQELSLPFIYYYIIFFRMTGPRYFCCGRRKNGFCLMSCARWNCFVTGCCCCGRGHLMNGFRRLHGQRGHPCGQYVLLLLWAWRQSLGVNCVMNGH
jgi:hypothetical protein